MTFIVATLLLVAVPLPLYSYIDPPALTVTVTAKFPTLADPSGRRN